MQRNPGIPFDPTLLAVHLSEEEVAARVAALDPVNVDSTRLRQLISLLDLTTLSGDDTDERVRSLCQKAREAKAAAVCVYPAFVAAAVEGMRGSGIPVASVAGAFPHGLSTLSVRAQEVRECVALGAREIDIVIQRRLALEGRWQELFEDVATLREAAGDTCLKTILATGELRDAATIHKAGLVALMAGSDFIKTSTGKEVVNATLPVGAAMAAAIRDYAGRTGFKAGLKAAGGIRTTEDALQWWSLVRQELGEEWLHPSLFRIGASGLLSDIENRLQEID